MAETIMLDLIRKADELGLDEIEVAADEILRLRVRIAELKAALKPFAEPRGYHTDEHYRAARAAIDGKKL